MLGLHALTAPPETVLITVILLVSVALFSLFGGGTENRSQKSILWALGIVVVLSFGRVILGPIPNVQPVTIGLLLVGAIYGARRGIGIAILVTVLSNIFLGTGIWTIFQAGGWSIVALGGAVATNQLIIDEKLMKSRLIFAGFIAAFVFDFMASLSVLIADPTPSVFIAYLITGLPFDLLHTAGNLVIAVTLGPSMHRILSRSLSSTSLNFRSAVNESRTE